MGASGKGQEHQAAGLTEINFYQRKAFERLAIFLPKQASFKQFAYV